MLRSEIGMDRIDHLDVTDNVLYVAEDNPCVIRATPSSAETFTDTTLVFKDFSSFDDWDNPRHLTLPPSK